MSASSRPVTGSGKRALVALAMGALMTPTLLAGPAFAQPVDPSETACPADVIDDAGFPDIQDLPADLQEAINCIAAYGITTGEVSGNYNATGTVSRAQMALFFSRIAQYAADNGADIELDATDAGFTDLEGVDDPTQDAINILANLGVVQGKGDGSIYDPTGRITRAQMASFIARFHEALGAPLAEDGDVVPDAFMDDENSVHEENINLVAFAGIAAGKTATMFAPGESTSRGQMARFLARHLEVAVSAGVIPAIGDQPEEPAVTIGDDGAVTAGANFTGVLANLPEGATVTVSGAGLTNQSVTVDAEGGFTIGLPANAPTGAQTLTFTITVGDETITLTADVTVAGPALQSLNVDPDAAVTLPLATTAQEGDPATRDQDNRTYTATGLTNGTTYRVTLVNATQISMDAQGNVTFLSEAEGTSSTGFAVATGADLADIVSVNNATITGTNSTTVQPVNGSITFVVEGDAPGTVVPVVYVEGRVGGTATTGGTSSRLETNATTASVAAGTFSASVETFGVGGATTFVAPLATAGTIASAPVTSVDKDNNSFTTGTGSSTVRYTYDAGDDFTLGGNSVGLDAFEAQLSSGDTIAGSFASDPGGRSVFNLTDTNPAAPAAVEAEKGATAATTNDITVTVDTTGTTDFDSVIIQRAAVVGNPADESAPVTANVGTFATIATATVDAAAAAGFQYVDNDVAAGAYVYRAALVNDGDQSGFTADDTVETSTTPVNDTTAPTAADTRLTVNNGSAFALDGDDAFTIAFSEPIAAPGAGDAFRVTDADGTVVDLVNGANAAFTLNTAAATTIGGTEFAMNTVLTVTIATAGVGAPAAGGTITGLGIPATITAQAGTTDVNTNAFNVAGSADVVIDNE